MVCKYEKYCKDYSAASTKCLVGDGLCERYDIFVEEDARIKRDDERAKQDRAERIKRDIPNAEFWGIK